MLGRSHRRRPPVPVFAVVVLLVVAVAAAAVALAFAEGWLVRGSVAALAAVVVGGVLLLRRVRRMLRRAEVETAGASSALALAENRASKALLRRDREIARLSGELGIARARLAEVTGASLYAATVLAELFRNTPLLAEAGGDVESTEGRGAVADDDEETADSATDPASSTVVQVWPSVDDAPTVVDLLRWDQVRRMTDEPVAEARRPA